MAVAKAEILDAIANMTVLELSELIKEMEEKFGVSAAAAAVAVAAPAAGGAAAAAEEQTEFTVMLNSCRREEGRSHQGGACCHRPGPEGSQGPGRRRAEGREGRRAQGRCRRAEEAAGRRWRHRRSQISQRRLRAVRASAPPHSGDAFISIVCCGHARSRRKQQIPGTRCRLPGHLLFACASQSAGRSLRARPPLIKETPWLTPLPRKSDCARALPAGPTPFRCRFFWRPSLSPTGPSCRKAAPERSG